MRVGRDVAVEVLEGRPRGAREALGGGGKGAMEWLGYSDEYWMIGGVHRVVETQ